MPRLLNIDPTRGRWWRRATTWLPDLGALCAALLCAVLAAVVVGSVGGCGGGVGTEGTGTYASVGSGPITGFGSIVVSGVRYDDSSASVTDDDGNASARTTLALGMVVDVEGGAVTPSADGLSLVATAGSVRIRRALLGPADAVNAAAGSVQVLGQRVLVTGDTSFGSSLVGGLSAVANGQVLEVWGLYDTSRTAWVATRIAVAAPGSSYSVSGTVASVDSSQSFTLGSQRYAGATSGLVVGSVVQVKLLGSTDASGRWVVAAQRADDPLPDEREGAGLDGVVSMVLSATRFTVNGTTVDSSAATVEGTVQVGAKVEVRGSLKAGVLVATKVEAGSTDDVRGYELKGSLTQLDTAARQFVVRGVLVDYSSARFKSGSAADLVGYAGKLEVKGQLSADGQTVVATTIEFDD